MDEVQPAQEPVAWMYQCTADNSGPVLLRHKTNWAESGTGLWIETPLYTALPLPVQPVQEPLHIVQSNGKHSPLLTHMMNKRTTPPKREWVSLTPKQVKECIENSYFHTAWSSEIDIEMLVNNIDAALQQLNT
jgi:hypothetical protein